MSFYFPLILFMMFWNGILYQTSFIVFVLLIYLKAFQIKNALETTCLDDWACYSACALWTFTVMLLDMCAVQPVCKVRAPVGDSAKWNLCLKRLNFLCLSEFFVRRICPLCRFKCGQTCGLGALWCSIRKTSLCVYSNKVNNFQELYVYFLVFC